MCCGSCGAVVSIGVILTFKVVFTPLEYNQTMAKRLYFFGSGFLLFNPVSSICILYFSRKTRVCNVLALPFSLRWAENPQISFLVLQKSMVCKISNQKVEYFCQVQTNIDDVGGIVGTYSSGVKTILKVGITPIETTGANE